MAREIEKLGKPRSDVRDKIARAVVVEVRGVLREQFGNGTSPDGTPWQVTKRGKPALLSKKLPQDFAGVPTDVGASFFSRVPWLKAHHDGHVFPARTQVLTFNQKGKLARRSKKVFDIATRKGRHIGKFVFDVVAPIKSRILPERPIYPRARMTEKWGAAVNRGIESQQAAFNKATLK